MFRVSEKKLSDGDFAGANGDFSLQNGIANPPKSLRDQWRTCLRECSFSGIKKRGQIIRPARVWTFEKAYFLNSL
jgi:hypothetical protein